MPRITVRACVTIPLPWSSSAGKRNVYCAPPWIRLWCKGACQNTVVSSCPLNRMFSVLLLVEQRATCWVCDSQPCSADLLPLDPSQPDLMVKMNVRREICLPVTFKAV